MSKLQGLWAEQLAHHFSTFLISSSLYLIDCLCLLSWKCCEEEAIKEASDHPAAVQRRTGVSRGAGGGEGLRGPQNLPGVQVQPQWRHIFLQHGQIYDAKEVALYQFNQLLLYITNGETVWLHYNVSNLMLHHYHKTVALKAAELLLDVRITETDVNTCHLPNTAEMLALSAATLSDLFVCC